MDASPLDGPPGGGAPDRRFDFPGLSPHSDAAVALKALRSWRARRPRFCSLRHGVRQCPLTPTTLSLADPGDLLTGVIRPLLLPALLPEPWLILRRVEGGLDGGNPPCTGDR